MGERETILMTYQEKLILITEKLKKRFGKSLWMDSSGKGSIIVWKKNHEAGAVSFRMKKVGGKNNEAMRFFIDKGLFKGRTKSKYIVDKNISFDTYLKKCMDILENNVNQVSEERREFLAHQKINQINSIELGAIARRCFPDTHRIIYPVGKNPGGITATIKNGTITIEKNVDGEYNILSKMKGLTKEECESFIQFFKKQCEE